MAQATASITKLAAIREPGHPMGQPAPCWMTCPTCGTRMPAFTTDQTCACGTTFAPNGYRR